MYIAAPNVDKTVIRNTANIPDAPLLVSSDTGFGGITVMDGNSGDGNFGVNNDGNEDDSFGVDVSNFNSVDFFTCSETSETGLDSSTELGAIPLRYSQCSPSNSGGHWHPS